MTLRQLLTIICASSLVVTAQAANQNIHHPHATTNHAHLMKHQNQQSISINQANLETLTMVKGIGPKKAQAIIDYRKAHGPFQSVEDLVKVKGIGKKKLAKIAQQLTI